ncbi:hypothetical protein Tsubulata_020975 [Turnera subulata]|uniref:Thiaminase-2/PQQC domain-containing protein n=1 Tax=Turnera subulata TaxID=218843 RepID=A0A9Q0FTN4_9ROSI|nr:hypothetical protein Tsubulata_020975 [Turnera subulata]
MPIPLKLRIPPLPQPAAFRLVTYRAAAPAEEEEEEEEEGLAYSIWKKCSREFIFALYTPFLVCMAAGNLDWKTYQYYLFQDIDYGENCIKVAEMAASITDDEAAKELFTKFKEGWERELERLKGYLDPGTTYPINPATESYKQYLLDTVSGKIEGQVFEGPKVAVFTLGAMMPCWRLYASLGQELLAALDGKVDADNPYKDWIESNGDPSLEDSTRSVEALLNKLTAPLTNEELVIIEKLYHKSMAHEIEFFLAPPTLDQPTVLPLKRNVDPANGRLLIFSGFEKTCIVVESSPVLADIAIVTATSNQADLRARWGNLFELHEEDYTESIEKIMSSEKVDQFSYDKVETGLEPFSIIEKRANSRVVHSRVLKGLYLEGIKQVGGRQIFLEGSPVFFQKISRNENLTADIHILSYSWCDELIKSSFASVELDGLSIHANQLMFKEQMSTGDINRTVETPANKLQLYGNILNSLNDGKINLSVFIGSSIGDLLCLVQANIGIVIGPSSSLKRVGSQLGVSFVALYPSLLKRQKAITSGGSPPADWKELSGVVYTVGSWAELDAFISGW